MQTTQIILIAAVAVPLFLVMLNRLRIDVAALLMAVVLGGLQWLGFGLLGPANSPGDAIKSISGFSQPVVITLISLFILTSGLEKSGATRWLARQILRIGGKSESWLIVLFATLTALLSLFMNNLAAGALALPSAMEASRRSGIRPSKLLIPVAYGSLLGGSATYFTTANIIVSDLLRIANPPQAALHILDFTPIGGLIALAGILVLGLLGKRLLPDREPAIMSQMAGKRSAPVEPEVNDAPVNRRQAFWTTLLTVAAIAASIAGVPIYLAMLAAAVLALILNILPISEAYQAVEWQAVFLIAGMYAVSLAMVQTGLATLLGNSMIALTLPLGPLGLAAGAYLLTTLLTQFMGGQVTALVTGPIAISAAISMGINPQAIAVATALGCSAAFLTPMAHPVNMLTVAPANYRFTDFLRIGGLLTLVSFGMLLVGLVLFWHL
jgi:di/tricarboxylate transporter